MYGTRIGIYPTGVYTGEIVFATFVATRQRFHNFMKTSKNNTYGEMTCDYECALTYYTACAYILHNTKKGIEGISFKISHYVGYGTHFIIKIVSTFPL